MRTFTQFKLDYFARVNDYVLLVEDVEICMKNRFPQNLKDVQECSKALEKCKEKLKALWNVSNKYLYELWRIQNNPT